MNLPLLIPDRVNSKSLILNIKHCQSNVKNVTVWITITVKKKKTFITLYPLDNMVSIHKYIRIWVIMLQCGD